MSAESYELLESVKGALLLLYLGTISTNATSENNIKRTLFDQYPLGRLERLHSISKLFIGTEVFLRVLGRGVRIIRNVSWFLKI